MPTIIVELQHGNKNFPLKSTRNIQGGLHWVLTHKMKAIIHNRDLGMHGANIDIANPPAMKRIFNAHEIKSFYNDHNSRKIRTFFSECVIEFKTIKQIDKLKDKGCIWLIPLYNEINFYPIYTFEDEKDIKEFLQGYNFLSENCNRDMFDVNNDINKFRKIRFDEEGLYVEDFEFNSE